LTQRGGGSERAGVGNPFLDGTVVRKLAPGRYQGDIEPIWNLRPMPQGGVVTAFALRAMAAELDDPTQKLRVLHTTFAATVADGPVDVDVEVIRRGRSMSHLRGEVRNRNATVGHLTTGIFGGPRQGYEFTDLEPLTPAPPHPDDCPRFRDPPPPEAAAFAFEPMPFWDRVVEGRAVLGHPPWERYEAGRAEVAGWRRFDEPPFLDDGTIDPFSLVVLCDTMPGAVGEKVGGDPDDPRHWFAPSVDLTVHLLDECRSPWVLCHNRARWAGDGYASADMAVWDYGPDCDDPTPRLVAYATQLFLFTFPS
jgi:acyl-CoA thioesterase